MGFWDFPRTNHLTHFWGLAQFLKEKGAADDLSISDTECVSAKVSNVLLETVSVFSHRQT